MNHKSIWKSMMVLVVLTVFILGAQISNGGLDYVSSAEAAETGESTVAAHIKAGDKLVADSQKVEKLEKAIKEYEAALKIAPDNVDALWKTALAYVLIIDIKTDALIVEKGEQADIKRYGEKGAGLC